jgi:hypothetical protein
MAAVPVILNGVFMPAGRTANDKPIKGTMIGYLSIEGLGVGGGPIIPPPGSGGTPEHPIVPPGGYPHPEHPIVIPPDQPPEIPIDPPEQPPSGSNVVVVVKPAPVTGGWGLAADASGSIKWFYMPVAQPKGGGR